MRTKEQKLKEREKGITMVALAVTITVLIILAGVSLNATIGDNGIITQAQKAKENMELARVEEEEQLNSLYEELAKGGEGIFDDSMADAIEKLENFRKVIATAITNEGVPTLETDTEETMAENISKILQARTKDATATAEDITEGKTAYVNGEKVVGTKIDRPEEIIPSLTFSVIKTACTNSSSQDLNETFTIPSDGKLIVNGASFFYPTITLTINDSVKEGTLVEDSVGDERRLVTFIEDVKMGDTVNIKSVHATHGNMRGSNMIAILVTE